MLEASSLFCSSLFGDTITVDLSSCGKKETKVLSFSSSQNCTYRRLSFCPMFGMDNRCIFRDSNYQLFLFKKGVGYLRIKTFSAPPSSILLNELTSLTRNLNCFIIDVQNNMGGNSSYAFTIASHFMKGDTLIGFYKYPVVYSRLFNQTSDYSTNYQTAIKYETLSHYLKDHLDADYPAHFFRGKLYLLQNRYTASAAEDFILSLQERNNTITIGEKTFGSTGDSIDVILPGGGMCKICNRRCLSAKGVDINNIGISPDINIDSSKDLVLTNHVSKVLNKAMDIIFSQE